MPPSAAVGEALRFATVVVDEFGRRPTREANRRPAFERIAALHRRPNDALRDQFVEPSAALRPRHSPRWNDLRNDAAMRRDRHALSRLDSSDVAAQVIFQLANAGGGHASNIATSGHIRKSRVAR